MKYLKLPLLYGIFFLSLFITMFCSSTTICQFDSSNFIGVSGQTFSSKECETIQRYFDRQAKKKYRLFQFNFILSDYSSNACLDNSFDILLNDPDDITYQQYISSINGLSHILNLNILDFKFLTLEYEPNSQQYYYFFECSLGEILAMYDFKNNIMYYNLYFHSLL